MTVQSTTARADYTGNGVTINFAVPFRFLANSHLRVLRTVIATNVATELILDSIGPDGYSVVGANNPAGGSITVVTPPTALERISIFRNVPITQTIDYIANDAFPAESHESGLDKLTMIVQQQGEVVDRAVVLSAQSVGVSNELPGPVALNLLRWKPDLSGIENAQPPAIATVADGAVVDATVSPIAGIQSTKLAFQQAGAGSALRDVQSKLRERISFEDYGAVGDGVADDTAAIQAAINANPGKDIYATRRFYRITSRINILNAVRLRAAAGGSEIQMATVNTDHIMIGDGTIGGKSTSLSTEIHGFTFTSAAGANFTTGSCIFVNYSSNLLIQDCFAYGKEGANVRLFRAMTLFRCAQSIVRNFRSSFMRDSHIFTNGSPLMENRTVDVRFESCYLASGGNHAMWWSGHSAGMFANDCIILDVGPFDALRIESDAATEQGTNFFVNNINIEGGNYASGRGIAIIKGSVVQIANGWIGGIIPPNPSVLVNALASDIELTGLRVDFGFLQVDGPATSVKSCEISGDGATNTVGVVVTAAAAGFLVAASRIKQFITSAISITGTPARGVISGVTCSSIGGSIITGANYSAGPSISGMRTNAVNAVVSAATINLDYGHDNYQVTGAAPNITDINPKCPGRRVVIQSGAGGITLSNASAVILPKGGAATVTVPQFRTIELFCDGSNWFEIGGNY